jgi:hypothetical protein
VKKSNLPAVAPSNGGALTMANWPTQRQIKDEAYVLEGFVESSKRMTRALDGLRYPSKTALDEAKNARDQFEITGRKGSATARSQDDWIDPSEPLDWRDEDGDVQRAQVSKMLAIFMGSFPTSNIKQPQIFTMQLLDDVMEREPSYAVLESTCRELRRTQKFMPSIAEFVAELDKQEDEWGARGGAHWWALDTYKKLVTGIPAAEAQLAAEQAGREKQRQAAEEKKRADDELRAQPLKAGDRVRNKRAYQMGPGTIADVFGDGFHVCYDDKGHGYVDGKDLQRLIPGDSGFEIVEGKRAAIEKRLAEYPVLLQRQRRPVVGDRVTDDIHAWRHPEDPPNGAGTVVFVSDFESDGFCFSIQFDNGSLGVNYSACSLSRLLPDDPEFERSEKVVAGWRVWELKHGVFVSTADLHDFASRAATSESVSMFAIGDRVAHRSFGLGTVVDAAGSTVGGLGVRFDESGYMRVAESFLERAE